MNREEVKQKVHERRVKKALKSYRLRPFKNFIFWFAGVLSSIGIIAGGIFVGVKIVPIKSYLGSEADQYVSETISSKSVLDAVMSIEDYKVGDIPALEGAINGIIESAGLTEYVEVDAEALKDFQLFGQQGGSEDLATRLTSCIKVKATLENLGVLELVGDVSNLETLTTWQEVNNDDLFLDSDGNIITTEDDELAHNPNMFYYVPESGNTGFAAGDGEPVDNSAYKKAFDETGKRIAPLNATLYYANISGISILEAVDLIDETFSRVEIKEVLTVFGVAGGGDGGDADEGEGSLNVGELLDTLLDGVTFGNISEVNIDEALMDTLNELKLYDLLQGDPDGQIYAILSSIFGGKAYNEISIGDFMNLAEGGEFDILNLKISSIFTDPDPMLEELLVTLTGVSSFDEVTLNSFQGDIGDNFANLKIETFLPLDSEGSDFEKLLLELTGADSYSEVTINHFKEIKFDDFKLSAILNPVDNQEIFDILIAMIGGNVTAEDLKLSDLQNIDITALKLSAVLEDAGDLGKILEDVVGKGYEEITVKDLADLQFDDIKICTVLPFDEGGNGSSGNVMLYRILLDVSGIAWTEDNLQEKAESLSINALSNFSAGGIKLSNVLTGVDDSFKDLLVSATGAESFEEITISDLSSLSIDDLKLTAVLPFQPAQGSNAGTENLYKVLLDASNIAWTEDNIAEKAEQISINQIKNFSFSGIRLSVVLSNVDERLEAVLVGAIEGVDSFDEITIDMLNGNNFDINKVALETVLTGANDTLKNLIMQATGQNSFSKVTVGMLGGQNFSLTNVKLATVLTNANDTMKNLITQATGASSFDAVTIGMLSSSSFSLTNVKLSTVLTSANDTLKNLIMQATGQNSFDKVTVGMLGGQNFSFTNVKLGTVLTDANDTLKTLIMQATGQSSFDNVTVGMLGGNNGFDVSKIRLGTVLKSSENPIISALLKDESVTLGNLGSAINDLTLYEIYGTECFTKVEADATTDKVVYKYVVEGSTKKFVLYEGSEQPTASNDLYYMHKDDGIWLLLCFETHHEDVVSDFANANYGRPKTYTISSNTIESLAGTNAFSTIFSEATIRELMDAGIITCGQKMVYAVTLQALIDSATGL